MPLFFLLAIISTTAYSLQSSLLVKQARSMDRLSLAVYRMLSLSIILLPMLLGVNTYDYQLLPQLLPHLLLSGICGGIYIWSQFYAVQFIPIGVANSLNQSVRTLCAFLLGYFLLEQTLVTVQALLIVVILLGTSIVASAKNPMLHLDNNLKRGVSVSLASGFLGSITFFILGFASKQANPYMIGYFWEFSILIGTLIILSIRRGSGGKGLQRISTRHFGSIALASSPTLIGTICAALALQQGSLAIFMAIASLSVIFTTIFGRLFYQEKLRFNQWIGVSVSLAGVIALKLFP